MAMDPEELEQIVNAISKGFEKAHASSPDSSKTFKEFDIGFRTTSKRLQDLAEVISKTTKGSAENNEAQKLFVRTLKGKINDIASSSGTLEEKMKVLGETIDKVDNVTDEYKKKVKDAASEQIKNTEATKIQKETTEKYNKALDNFGKSFAPLGNLVGGIIKSYQSGGSEIGVAGSLLAAEVGFAGDAAKMAGSGLQSVGAAASMSSSSLMRIAGIASTVAGVGLDLFGKGLNAVATKALPVLTAEADKSLMAFREISSTGAQFTDGVVGMSNAGAEAGLDLKQFSNVVKQNASNFTDAGLTVSEGSKKIGVAFEADKKAGGVMRDTLNRLGYSFEEQAGLVAETMANMSRLGGRADEEAIRRETSRYAEDLRILADLTGKDAKAKLKTIQDQNQIAAFQAQLAKKSPEQQRAITAGMSTMNETEQKAFRERIMNNGNLMTQETAMYEANISGAKEKGLAMKALFDENNFNLKTAAGVTSAYQNQITESSLNAEHLNIAAALNVKGMEVFNKTTLQNIELRNQFGDKEKTQKTIELAEMKEITAKKIAEDKKAAEARGEKYELPKDDITGRLLDVSNAVQDFKISLQKAFLTENVLGAYAGAVKDATKTITDLINEYGKTAGSANKAVMDWTQKLIEYLPLIGVAFAAIQTAISATQLVNSIKGPKPPPPSSDDTKPKPGPWSPKDNNPIGPAGPKSGPTGPVGGTGNKEPPKPATKPGIKGKFGAVLNGAAAIAGPVLEKSSALMAGASAVTNALEGNISGLVENIKEVASGIKVAGAESVKPATKSATTTVEPATETAKTTAKVAETVAKPAATTAAAEAAKPVAKVAETVAKPATTTASTLAKEGAESATKLAGKEAATLGAKTIGKSILKKLPGIGFLVGLANAGQRAMDGDWVGAGLEVASGAASTLPGPGTAASVALDATLAAKDAGLFGGKTETPPAVTPIAEPPTKLPENKPVVPTVPKVAGASVFDRTPGEGPAFDPRTQADKEKFDKAIAEGKSLKSVIDEINATKAQTTEGTLIKSQTPQGGIFDDPATAKARGVEKAETLDTSTEIGRKIADQIKAVNAISNTGQNVTGNLNDTRTAALDAMSTMLPAERQAFSGRISDIQPREAFINRTGMLPDAQNVAPNNPKSKSDLDTQMKEIVAAYEKNRAELDKNDPLKKITSMIPSTATTDDVVQAIQGLAMQFGRAVGLLDDIASHAGSTASNTRKQLQGQ